MEYPYLYMHVKTPEERQRAQSDLLKLPHLIHTHIYGCSRNSRSLSALFSYIFASC